MKNKIMLLSVALALALSFVTVAFPKPKAEKFYMGGCTLGGAAYMCAQAAGTMMREKAGINVTIEATGCGVDNVALMQRGEVQFAIAALPEPYKATRAIPPYKAKHGNIMGWYPMYDLTCKIIVLKDSPIRKLEDLRGKRIAFEVIGSAGETVSREIFEAIGLPYKDMYGKEHPALAFSKVFHLSEGPICEALKAGTIDAGVPVGGVPDPKIMEMSITNPFRVIEIPEKLILEKVVPLLPLYTPMHYDHAKAYGKGYVGPGKDWVVASYTVGVAHKDVRADVVYKATKAIWENRKAMKAWHPSTILMDYKMIRVLESSLPMHPGAKKFYEEAGVWTDKPLPIVKALPE